MTGCVHGTQLHACALCWLLLTTRRDVERTVTNLRRIEDDLLFTGQSTLSDGTVITMGP